MNRILATVALASLISSLAAASDGELKDCLAQSGEVAPNAEALALAVGGALTKDKFLHRAYLSPMEYRMLDAKKLAEMLVARLHEECELPRKAPNSEPIDTEIIMMIPSANLETIARLGFQNQHATATSGGSNAATARYMAEQDMMGMQMPYGGKMREVLPKYSALNLKSKKYGAFNLPSNYGDTAVVFKESLKKRTTFTFTDSLRMSAFQKDAAKSAYPPRTANFEGPENNDPSKNMDLKCEEYCEAQIWGPIDMSDADYLLVRDAENIPDSVKNLGVAVYQLETSANGTYGVDTKFNPDQAASYRRGKLLVPAAPKKLSASQPSRPELEAEAAKAAGGALKNILENKLIGQRSDQELIQQFQALSAEPAPEIQAGVGLGYFNGGPMSNRTKVFSEIATRPLSPDVEKLLLAERNNANENIRRAALLGLSDLPFDRFRPILLEALDDKSQPVQTLAVALAMDTSDPEIIKKLKAIPEPEGGFLQLFNSARAYRQWSRKKYCAAE